MQGEGCVNLIVVHIIYVYTLSLYSVMSIIFQGWGNGTRVLGRLKHDKHLR